MSERSSSLRGDSGGGRALPRVTYGSVSSTTPTSPSSPPDNNNDDDADSSSTTSSSMGSGLLAQQRASELRSTLSLIQRLSFGLGHVYNDLCAGVWFSYTLVFLKGVLQMAGTEAGALVWWGQVVDAISTPICGVITDRYSSKRKWHVLGTFLVLISFPAIFSMCPFCDGAPSFWPPLYYAIVVALFQFAWPLVQIANLAMIPELSRTQRDRMDLTSIRYAASVVSSVIVYLVTWLIIRSKNVDEKNIGPLDWFRFRDISLILTLIGISMTVLFHFSLSLSNYGQRRALSAVGGQRRDSHTQEADAGGGGSEERTHLLANAQGNRRRRSDYLKSPLLYQNAFLYVFSRLFMTSALLYMPLWLDERNKTPVQFFDAPDGASDVKTVEHLATVPLVSFVASFMASVVMNLTHLGHQVSYMLGSVIGLGASAWVALGTPASASQYQLYAVAILLGAGSSITMISSLSITADMIGPNTKLGGFVYSAVTFFDKLVTGFVVIIIEAIKCDDCQEYYKFVLAYACGVAALLGLVTLISLKLTKTCMRSPGELLANSE